jgi:hypothetical protein
LCECLTREHGLLAGEAAGVPGVLGSSIDRNLGTGVGNGMRPYSADSGYAGTVSTPGDTGWEGEIAGALNRFLRWDATRIVDTIEWFEIALRVIDRRLGAWMPWPGEIERFEIPLRVIDGAGGAPPAAGYPTTGDKLEGRCRWSST